MSSDKYCYASFFAFFALFVLYSSTVKSIIVQLKSYLVNFSNGDNDYFN